MMIKLLALFLLMTPAVFADNRCEIESPELDYLKVMGESSGESRQWLVKKDQLGEISLLFLSDRETCGSQGCQTIIYAKKNSCYVRVMQFSSHYKWTPKTAHSEKKLVLIQKPKGQTRQYLCHYQFKASLLEFEKITSECESPKLNSESP